MNYPELMEILETVAIVLLVVAGFFGGLWLLGKTGIGSGMK